MPAVPTRSYLVGYPTNAIFCIRLHLKHRRSQLLRQYNTAHPYLLVDCWQRPETFTADTLPLSPESAMQPPWFKPSKCNHKPSVSIQHPSIIDSSPIGATSPERHGFANTEKQRNPQLLYRITYRPPLSQVFHTSIHPSPSLDDSDCRDEIDHSSCLQVQALRSSHFSHSCFVKSCIIPFIGSTNYNLLRIRGGGSSAWLQVTGENLLQQV